uniref:Glutaminyl-peptide cyclotransferase n=1 Tax=Panagrolaimus sp. ES5 TaxID=591445 RepID=A0AC34F9B4_9BILA
MTDFGLKLEPAERIVIANKKLGEEPAHTTFRITNNGKDRCAFKVKSTGKDCFEIDPQLGILRNGDSTSIALTFNGGKTVPESGKHYVAIYYIKVGDDKKTARQFWQDHKGEATATKRLYVDFKKEDAAAADANNIEKDMKEEGKKDDEKKDVKEKDEKEDDTYFEPVNAVRSPAVSPMKRHKDLYSLLLIENEPEFQMKLDPEAKVIFKGDKLAGSEAVVPVKLTNITKSRQCFKVKTTSNDIFRVRPPLGFVNINEIVTINIVFAAKELPPPNCHSLAVYHIPCKGDDIDPLAVWDQTTKPEGVRRLVTDFKEGGTAVTPEKNNIAPDAAPAKVQAPPGHFGTTSSEDKQTAKLTHSGRNQEQHNKKIKKRNRSRNSNDGEKNCIKQQRFITAIDSAVLCAMLLDLARTLGPLLHQRTNNHITLQLIFLDGEEAFVNWSPTDSIYGARHLADLWTKKWYPSTDGSSFDLSKKIDRIDVFMLLDLLGTRNPRITSTYGHGTTELFQEFLKIENTLRSLGHLKQRPNAFYSGTTFAAVEDDHIAFMQKGVPIMHLISVPFPRVWHTPADNEKALDYDTIENLNHVVRVFVARYLGVIIPPSNG